MHKSTADRLECLCYREGIKPIRTARMIRAILLKDEILEFGIMLAQFCLQYEIEELQHYKTYMQKDAIMYVWDIGD